MALMRASLIGLLLLASAVPVVGLLLALIPDPGLLERMALAGLSPPTMKTPWPVLMATGSMALCVSGCSLAWGTLLAVAEHRWRIPRYLSMLALSPLAVPSYVLAASAQRALDPSGWLGALVGADQPFAGWGAAVVVLTVVSTPYVQLLVGAALRRVPYSEEEAARKQ